ncbi:hypothetical protein BJ165DRAFT_1427291 [Panaeolus papilionaceus]|nr:hypothetical protein BJ165DRAFT_1427291 [Panaeolus papilionaceus]
MITESDNHGGCTIPVELLVHIFGYLLDENSLDPAIHHSCLACKQFNDILLPLIFNRGVELGYCPPERPCANLKCEAIINIITQHPHLIREIHQVSLRVNGSTAWFIDQESVDPLGDGSPLLHLPNLHSLSIHVEDTSLQYNSLLKIVDTFRRFLNIYLHTGTLTTLSIYNLKDIPLFDILASSSLKILKFDACTLEDVEAKSVPLPLVANGSDLVRLEVHSDWLRPFPMLTLQHLPKLERVKFSTMPPHYFMAGSTPFVPHIFRHLSKIETPRLRIWRPFCPGPHDGVNPRSPFPVLKELSVAVVSSNEEPDAVCVLDHIESLKELELSIVDLVTEIDQFIPPYLLRYRNTLEVVSFNWDSIHQFLDEDWGYPLDKISMALQRVSGRNILRTINLSMGINILHVEEPYSFDITLFTHLTHVLCSPHAFPRLKQVVLHATVFEHEEDFKGNEQTFEMIRSALGSDVLGLYASNSIEFVLRLEYVLDPLCGTCEMMDKMNDSVFE